MCHQRLADGEAPACVQACPTEAIRIVKVKKSKGSTLFPSKIQNPESKITHSTIPDSTITRPTTRYVDREIPASATAADREALVPQHAHWPLVLMLVFTQAGIGLLLTAHGNLTFTLVGTAIFFSGMGASVFHLGQPLKAWRFFLGLRTSWLSREILAFSLFAPIPMALSAFAALPYFPKLPIPPIIADWIPLCSLITDHSALIIGLIAVFTSVMIYHDTHRSLWRFPLGAARLFGTVASFAALGNLLGDTGIPACSFFAAAVLLKLIPELRLLQLGEDEDTPWSPDVHSARLQLGPLGIILRARITFGLLAIPVSFIHPWLALPILLFADLLERQLFFQSVHAPKMPGNFGPEHGH
jgi:DMSO reductase anchor subunit